MSTARATTNELGRLAIRYRITISFKLRLVTECLGTHEPLPTLQQIGDGQSVAGTSSGLGVQKRSDLALRLMRLRRRLMTLPNAAQPHGAGRRTAPGDGAITLRTAGLRLPCRYAELHGRRVDTERVIRRPNVRSSIRNPPVAMQVVMTGRSSRSGRVAGPHSGFRIEPSWTEPPPFGWVFIGGRERPVCRRQSVANALSGPERCWPAMHRCEDEHVPQGRGSMQPEKARQ